MKKFAAFVSVFAAVMMFAAMVQAKRPVSAPGMTEYEGALKSANVDVRGDLGDGQQRMHFVAKNKGRALNTNVAFDNISGYVSGSVVFGNEGLYVTFDGPVNMPNFNQARGNISAAGAILVDGNLGYDVDTNSITGTDGSILQFDGAMDLKMVIKSSNNMATLKGKISASNANLVVFANSSTVSTTPVSISVKLPAIQLKDKTNGNGN